jgi:hypothetical protein
MMVSNVFYIMTGNIVINCFASSTADGKIPPNKKKQKKVDDQATCLIAPINTTQINET